MQLHYIRELHLIDNNIIHLYELNLIYIQDL